MSKRVLITGASSGIGREFARVFARERYELVLVARDKEALKRVAGELEADYGSKVSTLDVDLTSTNAAKTVHQFATKKNEPIDVLVNNAGVGDYGLFANSKLDKAQTMVDLNIAALTQLTHYCLPDMIRRKNGKILNVASTAAFFPGPLMAVYYATKAYVLNFSLALEQEVKLHNIGVTVLCPGPTRTHFQDQANANNSRVFKNRTALASASSVADLGYRSLMNGKSIAVHGFNSKILVFSSRFLPRNFIARQVLRVQNQAKRN